MQSLPSKPNSPIGRQQTGVQKLQPDTELCSPLKDLPLDLSPMQRLALQLEL